MKSNKLLIALFAGALFFASCSDNDDLTEAPLGDYANGIIVLNEGGFGHGDSQISYIANSFAESQNNIFELVNAEMTLGDTGQDIGFYNDLAFVVVNGSDKIEVVNRYTMKHVATIASGLDSPRYIAFANGKGYVTNWGDGYVADDDFVAVINLSNYTVSSTIPVAEGPERMAVYEDKLYVAQKGGYNQGSTLSVINTASNTLSTTIEVGDVPTSMVIKNTTLYVLCSGSPSWAPSGETLGSLHKVSLNGGENFAEEFAEGKHPSNLVAEGDKFYFTENADIFAMEINAELPSTPLFSTTEQGVYGVYGFEVENGKIFVGDAVDYSSNGKVYIYSLTGTLEHNYTVGVIPSGFYFNN